MDQKCRRAWYVLDKLGEHGQALLERMVDLGRIRKANIDKLNDSELSIALDALEAAYSRRLKRLSSERQTETLAY